MMRMSFGLKWQPTQRYSAFTARRFASNIRLRTEPLGPQEPRGKPKTSEERAKHAVGTCLYLVEPKNRKGSFRRFLSLAWTEAPTILVSVACVCAYSAATLAIPHGFGTLIDWASRGEIPVGLSQNLITWFMIAGAANAARLAFVGLASERLIARLRNKLYEAILGRPCAFFDDEVNRTAGLVQRLTNDVGEVGQSLTGGLTVGMKNICQTVGSIGVMLFLCPKLTGVMFGVLPPVILMSGIFGSYIRKLSQQKQDGLGSKATIADERLSGIRIVKAFAREKDEIAFYKEKVDYVMKVSSKMSNGSALYAGALHFTGYMVLFTLIWASSLLVAQHEISGGVMFSFMMYTIYCGIGIAGIVSMITELNKGYGASLRVFDIIDLHELELKEQAEAAKLSPPVILRGYDGLFEFKKISFAYPTRPNAPIYSSLSLKIRPGQCTCVVGTSGSGKSTLAMLLLKLYDANYGLVTLDGKNIDELDTPWLRKQIGYVPQEPVLFGGTIAQNIAYGIPDKVWSDPIDNWTMAAVVDASTKANAHEFISALPKGYDTFVGEGGRSLSGGQKQRIAIARALVKTPQLLVLDEATSALDSESEFIVQEAIEHLIDETRAFDRHGSRSVLIFAHKLSMIRKADVIAVLHEGDIIEEGTFEEVSKNPIFRQIVGLEDLEKGAAGSASKKNEEKSTLLENNGNKQKEEEEEEGEEK